MHNFQLIESTPFALSTNLCISIFKQKINQKKFTVILPLEIYKWGLGEGGRNDPNIVCTYE
jgi:hypothetical protein